MKIAVLIKQTPDTAELPKVSAEAVSTHNVQATMVINPWDEFAAEEAIQLAERFNAETVAISLGPAEALDGLKHALAMGVDAATLIDSGADPNAIDLSAAAKILAAAVQAEGDVDLVITGKQSVDGNSSAAQVGIARKLGVPLVTNVVKVVDIADGSATVERLADGIQETVQVALPAVLSVGKEINEPRYPNFMGIRRASRAQIPTRELDELGLGDLAPLTQWANIRKPESRRTQVQMIEGSSPADKAEKLVDALLAEKVI
ncbi:MAG: electron transfer flavoprotein subunit beta/FixA family protein [Litorilinea sp.]